MCRTSLAVRVSTTEMNAPAQTYRGYLDPHVDLICAMHRDGHSTRAIAEALYRLGARADTTDLFTTTKMKREHHIKNLRLMVLHVLKRARPARRAQAHPTLA